MLAKLQEIGLEVLDIKFEGNGVYISLECDITLSDFSVGDVIEAYKHRGSSVYEVMVRTGPYSHESLCWPDLWEEVDGLVGGLANYKWTTHGHRIRRSNFYDDRLTDVLHCIKRWIDEELKLKSHGFL